jgi:MFS family permease
VHQTKYLTEIGFSSNLAVWALGWVSLLGIPSQIVLGHLSDRIGREWIWTISAFGFAICFAALVALTYYPSLTLVGVMVLAQGLLGYGVTAIMAAVVVEIFEGRHYGVIFGTVMLAGLAGAAMGPWVTGVLHDIYGDYVIAFSVGIAMSFVGMATIWLAGPGKIRVVAGQAHRVVKLQQDAAASPMS